MQFTPFLLGPIESVKEGFHCFYFLSEILSVVDALNTSTYTTACTLQAPDCDSNFVLHKSYVKYTTASPFMKLT
jgi:hypothetical protein